MAEFSQCPNYSRASECSTKVAVTNNEIQHLTKALTDMTTKLGEHVSESTEVRLSIDNLVEKDKLRDIAHNNSVSHKWSIVDKITVGSVMLLLTVSLNYIIKLYSLIS